MQIEFERTGGFAGMRMAAKVDSNSLSREDTDQLRKLVDEASFFKLPTDLTGPVQGADRYLYAVTVEVEGRRHTVRTSDASAPATLRPLLEWLTNAARKARGAGDTT